MALTRQAVPTTFPAPLYHYTTQAGLLGIAHDNAIWATNIHYLNDESEFRHAIELTRTYLQHCRQKSTEEQHRLINELFAVLESIRSHHVFVCSFSERGDLLSQWRSYSRGGQGYAIGLDFNLPEFTNTLREQRFDLVRCEYDSEEQGRLVTALVREAFDGLVLEDEGYNLRRKAKLFLLHFLQLAPLLKHPAFAEEKEWRIVSRPTFDRATHLRFRAGRVVIIPYVDFNLPPPGGGHPFADVIVGPSANRNLAMESTTALLSGMSRQVTASLIPYREW